MVTKRTQELFQKAAANVPAYRDFLSSHHISPDSIKTNSDFRRVPITSKKNYLEQYPLPELLWGGKLNRPLIFCATSGSTGIPYYFPRTEQLSQQYSEIAEAFLRQRPERLNKPTLVIIAFGMGVWIGGVITLRALEIATERLDLPVSLLPVGYNKGEVLKALTKLSPRFGQTMFVGYPPFVKEIVDEAGAQQIDLKSLNVRLWFAAESFTETFRDYLCKKTGADPIKDTMNIYGTADIGAMANETPLSILIRRLAVKNKKLFRDIFGQIEKTPTLAQFNPRHIEFEEVAGEILVNGNSALPLIRYAVGDHGGVVTYDAMTRIFAKNQLDIEQETRRAGISNIKKQHPFVFVYERSNFAISLHGMIIYPEFIKEALLSPELASYVSQKFTMTTKFDKKQNQYLEINTELQSGVKPSIRLSNLTKKVVHKNLVQKSSEFAEVSSKRDSKSLIKIVFWSNGHSKYFAPGVKQRWVLDSK